MSWGEIENRPDVRTKWRGTIRLIDDLQAYCDGRGIVPGDLVGGVIGA